MRNACTFFTKRLCRSCQSRKVAIRDDMVWCTRGWWGLAGCACVELDRGGGGRSDARALGGLWTKLVYVACSLPGTTRRRRPCCFSRCSCRGVRVGRCQAGLGSRRRQTNKPARVVIIATTEQHVLFLHPRLSNTHCCIYTPQAPTSPALLPPPSPPPSPQGSRGGPS